MERSSAGSGSGIVVGNGLRQNWRKDQVRVKMRTLQAVLEECQIALQLISTTGGVEDGDNNANVSPSLDEDQRGDGLESLRGDSEADELRNRIKSRVEGRDFLEKLEGARASVPLNVAEEGSTWDMISEVDLWEEGSNDLHQEDYVVVREDDIVDGITCFMAAYLQSLKETKELTPNQLQEALSKAFSFKRKQGKLRKAWEGSKVLYNVASWSATAIGIYQNPVILQVAYKAFWTSCHVISRLL